MDDQTKSIETLNIEGSIEHIKHNQLDIRYLNQLFIRNPQLGCLASHYKETQTITILQNLGFNAQVAPLDASRAFFPQISIVVCFGICALSSAYNLSKSFKKCVSKCVNR